MLGKLVKVTWQDAHGSAANIAYTIDEIPHSPVIVESYGILLKDDAAGISIASEKCDVDCWRGYGFMPRGMVTAVTLVTAERKPRLRTKKPALVPVQKEKC